MSHTIFLTTQRKHLCWKMCVAMACLLPRRCGLLVCRILMASLGARQPVDALRAFFELEDSLRWYVDQAAISYGDGIHPKHRLIEYHDFFSNHIDAGEHVLDVGCGQGVVSHCMATQGAYVTGIDINSENVAKAKQRFQHDGLQFIVGDVMTFAPACRYDVIVMSNVLEHLDERVDLLKSLALRYRPRCFLFRVPMTNRHWSVPLRIELGYPAVLDPTHRVEYTLPSFKEEMSAAGLSLVEYQINWGEIWAKVSCAGN